MAKTPAKENAEMQDAYSAETAAKAPSGPGKAKPDPVGKPVEPGKAAPTEIPASEPYPTGKGRDPEEDFFQAHGFRRTPKE